MLNPEFKYYGIKSRLTDKTYITDMVGLVVDPHAELYTSVYRFDEAVSKLDSLANLPPSIKCYSDFLIFDLDSMELENAYADTVRLCDRLKEINAVHYVYFSGNKGFHIYVPSLQFGFKPTVDDGVLKRMAEFLGGALKSFDPSIYNKTRIFRYPNTLNAKSGLYKIPLLDVKATDLSTILGMAKEPADWNHELDYSLPKNHDLVELYKHCETKVIRKLVDSDPKISHIDFGLLKQAEEGKRNATLHKMSRQFARRAVPERDMLIIAHWWNKTLPTPMSADEVDRTVRSAYRYGMNELAADLPHNVIYNAKQAIASMRLMYQNWDKNAVKTGYKFFDEYTMGFWRGEVIFIISRPGNFKTCTLSNILHGIANTTKRPCLFFSMEMGYDALTMRHIQKAERMTQLEAMTAIKDGLAFEKTEAEFSNVHIISLSSLNTDRVIDLIDKFREEHGDLGAIGFDYLSLFEGCANNTERTARMATELKTRVAKAGDCPVFCLVQAKREYEGHEGDIQIDKTAGKDSSSIEDSGDYVIGTWGYWVKEAAFNDQGEIYGSTLVKRLYGGFLKSRKFASEIYPLNPFFEIQLERQYMNVIDFRYTATPPQFNTKKEFD